MHQFHPMLLSDLEWNAPAMLQYLNQPWQSVSRCETTASRVAHQVEKDLASKAQIKESVT